ncbi:MAG TPA: hypothetical protein VFK56_01720 [Mycobacterium sp.]|nr:hypothetical protein [Mycobacterium sp.]
MLQPLLPEIRAQPAPHGVTIQVESMPGPFGMNVPLKSSAMAGLATPTAVPASMTVAAIPAATFMLPPVR